MAITKLSLNGIEYPIGEDPQNYEGRELSESWDDIKQMCQNGDFKDLRVGDYKQIKVGTEDVVMEIAGIDCYYNTGNQETYGDYTTTNLAPVPHHIDWISRDCLTDLHAWNSNGSNNASGNPSDNDGTDVPWLQSDICAYLDDVYAKLPKEVQDTIINKCFLLERRGNNGGEALTESTGWHFYPMGRLWLPTEYEVFGSCVWSGNFGAGQALQYPIFANSYKHRIKGKGKGGARCHWWLASVRSGNSTNCCYVSSGGHANSDLASNLNGVPVCFRTAATTKLV